MVKPFSYIDMKFAIQELIFGAGMFASLIDLNPSMPYTYTMLEFKNLSLSKFKFFKVPH